MEQETVLSRAFSGLMPACTVVGGITGCYQLYLWVDEHRKQEKEVKRKKHAAKLNAKLKEEKNREVLLAAAMREAIRDARHFQCCHAEPEEGGEAFHEPPPAWAPESFYDDTDY